MTYKVRNILASAIVGASLYALPANAMTTIDFDTDANGNPIASGTDLTDQYASLGVTFQLFENSVLSSPTAFASSDFVGGAGSGNGLFNVFGSIFPQNAATQFDVLRILFSNPVSNLSFLSNGFGDQTTFNAYDIGGSLLGTFTNATGGAANVNFAFSNISRIDALQGDDAFAYRIDNLSFEAAGAVPEPGTWMLMILGLGAVGFAMRKRQKAAVRFQYA